MTLTNEQAAELFGACDHGVSLSRVCGACLHPRTWIDCTTPGCYGDGRYAAPGKGHRIGCVYPMDRGSHPTEDANETRPA